MTPRAGFRWEWERRFRDSPIESGPKLVGLVMATFGNVDGQKIYPSTDRLATACGMNVKTVRKHRDELIEAGRQAGLRLAEVELMSVMSGSEWFDEHAFLLAGLMALEAVHRVLRRPSWAHAVVVRFVA